MRSQYLPHILKIQNRLTILSAWSTSSFGPLRIHHRTEWCIPVTVYDRCGRGIDDKDIVFTFPPYAHTSPPYTHTHFPSIHTHLLPVRRVTIDRRRRAFRGVKNEYKIWHTFRLGGVYASGRWRGGAGGWLMFAGPAVIDRRRRRWRKGSEEVNIVPFLSLFLTVGICECLCALVRVVDMEERETEREMEKTVRETKSDTEDGNG